MEHLNEPRFKVGRLNNRLLIFNIPSEQAHLGGGSLFMGVLLKWLERPVLCRNPPPIITPRRRVDRL